MELKESATRLEARHREDVEALKTAHADAVRIVEDASKTQVERAWEEVEVRAELVNQGYKTIESLKAQVAERDSAL